MIGGGRYCNIKARVGEDAEEARGGAWDEKDEMAGGSALLLPSGGTFGCGRSGTTGGNGTAGGNEMGDADFTAGSGEDTIRILSGSENQELRRFSSGARTIWISVLRWTIRGPSTLCGNRRAERRGMTLYGRASSIWLSHGG